MPMPATRARRISNQRFDLMRINIRAGDRRHPETLSYRCCLSTLAGFGRLCRAGPARTKIRIIEAVIHVNCDVYESCSMSLHVLPYFSRNIKERLHLDVRDTVRYLLQINSDSFYSS